jgi:hypothetical protein
MGIDPTIAMGYKSPDINLGADAQAGLKANILAMEPAVMQQGINASQANQALTEAQTPGAVADSAIKSRDAGWQQWLGLHADKFRKTDAQGNDAGPDFPAMIAASNAAGFPDKAEALAAAHADRLTKDISNVKDQTNVDLLKTQATNTLMANIASQVDAKADPATQAIQYKRARDIAVHASGGDGSYADQMIPLDLPKNVAAWKTGVQAATITPEAQQNIAIAKENADTANQQVVQQGRNLNMIAQDHIKQAQADYTIADQFKHGAQTVQGLDFPPTLFGAYGAKLWNGLLGQNPAYKETGQLIDLHNSLYPNMPLSFTDGKQTIYNTLLQDSIKGNASGTANNNTAISGGALFPVNKTPITGGKSSAMTGPIDMINPKTGKVLYKVDPKHQKAAADLGFIAK